MWTYQPPIRDMMFVANELLAVQQDWSLIPQFKDIDAELLPQILEEAGRFASETLVSLNAVGDAQGCSYELGSVKTPKGFVDAYRRYCDAGWPSLACDKHWGGQGLPQILNAALYEMLFATNHGWSMYPGIAHGAYECLRAFATPEIQGIYLSKIVSGEWLSTMCLTEPQAGSDVGLVRTRAEQRTDGSYSLTGSKIFISGGNQDLTDNIIHLVLARLPDAPAGTKGISLFLVPKNITNADQKVLNGIQCTGIEKKMGIKGSATCVMNFLGAKGWLIGEPHRGLASMFVMMNSARLYVGLQGLGHAEMAYQNACRYAVERRQMRAVSRPDGGLPPARRDADPIAFQPSVRKSLLTMRALIEGERALGFWCAHLLDIADHHPDALRRDEAHGLASILTPIVKSFFTENGFLLASAALQIWGGYGYVHEFGIEQTVRDSRIAMIYEGTNEIQAIDLLVRKVIADGGTSFQRLLRTIIHEASLSLSTAGCELFGGALLKLHKDIARLTQALITEAPGNPEQAYAVSADFLRLIGLATIGSLWSRAARIAITRLREHFYKSKFETAKFYFDYVLPESQLRIELIGRRGCTLPWIDENH
ncbi:MAG TPA: acyl-CoA dehydrogenase family protein [Steroidobacteraceae bacterium]